MGDRIRLCTRLPGGGEDCLLDLSAGVMRIQGFQIHTEAPLTAADIVALRALAAPILAAGDRHVRHQFDRGDQRVTVQLGGVRACWSFETEGLVTVPAFQALVLWLARKRGV